MTAKASTSTRKSPHHPNPLTPEQTRAWIAAYIRHSRLYVRIFFIVASGLIFGLIWWELGEINQDLLSSFTFAVLVFFILAWWSRRKTDQSWSGIISDKYIKEVRRTYKNGETETSFYPRIIVTTNKGKKITLPLPRQLYDYFKAYDEVFKISGLEWPEKNVMDKYVRICPVCGTLFTPGHGQCSRPRCHSPELDHVTLRKMARLP